MCLCELCIIGWCTYDQLYRRFSHEIFVRPMCQINHVCAAEVV